MTGNEYIRNIVVSRNFSLLYLNFITTYNEESLLIMFIY